MISKDQSEQIDRAVAILKQGGLVAIPTETVYGLAADASNSTAIGRIFDAKGRPANHPLIVHLAGREFLADWALEIPDSAWRLAERFWPGPLTLVLRKRSHVLNALTGHQTTVGLRVPQHPITLELLRRFAGGLAAPSANRFTKVSPTTAQHVEHDLGNVIDLILDGGPCAIGIESTIVDFTQTTPVILRLGAISQSEMESVIQAQISTSNTAQTASPGQHRVHYSPNAELIEVTTETFVDEVQRQAIAGARTVVLAQFAAPLGVVSCDWWELPQTSADLAREIYAIFRRVDEAGYDVALILTNLNDEIGSAVRDRIQRASAK